MILVYLGRWSYGRFKDDNNIFYKMKNDLTTGTWQDDIWCPIIIILLCTSDVGCGGYSTTLNFWCHLLFPKEGVKRMLLHLNDNSDKMFISINYLKYLTIYWTTVLQLSRLQLEKINNDWHPVVLCVTDNTSALNWTLHTSKKLIIGRALVRLFWPPDRFKCWCQCQVN